MNFLPAGYEKLKTTKPYINLGKLPEGEHRFRIVSRPICGWLDWKDKKPYRYKPEDKPKSSFNPDQPMKPFWALHVWDYAKEGLYVMEITQNTIKKALESYASNEDWGDLTSFDIKLKKTGSGKDTIYEIIPVPHKPMSDVIKKAVNATPIRLEALYEGKDPWTDLEEGAAVHKATGEIVSESAQISDDEFFELLNMFEILGDDSLDKAKKMFNIISLDMTPKIQHGRLVEYLKSEIQKKGMIYESPRVA